MARTLVLIKHDAHQYRKEIRECYLDHGLTIVAEREMSPLPLELAEVLYAEHYGLPFYDRLMEHMLLGTTIALVLWGGKDVCQFVRDLHGHTDPAQAERGTIRARYGTPRNPPANAVHGSADDAAAAREIKLFFPDL